MAKRLTAEEARARVISNMKEADSARIDWYMAKYAVYRDMKEADPEEYENEFSMIREALFGHPEEAVPANLEPEVTEVAEIEAEINTEVEVQEVLQLPAVQDPAPVAVIEVEEAETMDRTPKADTAAKVAEAVVTGAKMVAQAAVIISRLAVAAWKASLPWVVKGAKALYNLALMVIYSSLDVADAIKTWAPFGARKVQGWVVYSLIPGARKAARATRRAGSIALGIVVAGSHQAAGIAIVAALVAVKAGAAMVQGATVVAGGCKAGWQMRQEIIDEEREAA